MVAPARSQIVDRRSIVIVSPSATAWIASVSSTPSTQSNALSSERRAGRFAAVVESARYAPSSATRRLARRHDCEAHRDLVVRRRRAAVGFRGRAPAVRQDERDLDGGVVCKGIARNDVQLEPLARGDLRPVGLDPRPEAVFAEALIRKELVVERRKPLRVALDLLEQLSVHVAWVPVTADEEIRVDPPDERRGVDEVASAKAVAVLIVEDRAIALQPVLVSCGQDAATVDLELDRRRVQRVAGEGVGRQLVFVPANRLAERQHAINGDRIGPQARQVVPMRLLEHRRDVRRCPDLRPFDSPKQIEAGHVIVMEVRDDDGIELHVVEGPEQRPSPGGHVVAEVDSERGS